METSQEEKYFEEEDFKFDQQDEELSTTTTISHDSPPTDGLTLNRSSNSNSTASPNLPTSTTSPSSSQNISQEPKPGFSYASLIAQAINSTEEKKLTLNNIYAWISSNYPYYKPKDSGWQNSIRHNLSLNKCFMKVPRTETEPGKGAFWAINPDSKDSFENGTMKKKRTKTPIPPSETSENNDEMTPPKKRRMSLPTITSPKKTRKASISVEIEKRLSESMYQPIITSNNSMTLVPPNILRSEQTEEYTKENRQSPLQETPVVDGAGDIAISEEFSYQEAKANKGFIIVTKSQSNPNFTPQVLPSATNSSVNINTNTISNTAVNGSLSSSNSSSSSSFCSTPPQELSDLDWSGNSVVCNEEIFFVKECSDSRGLSSTFDSNDAVPV